MDSSLINTIEIHKLSNVFTESNNLVDVLRLDKLHPIISGNKFFKLRFYIDEALKTKKSIVTFGGAYSNHIVATAFACLQNGIECRGIIRGEQPNKLSETLLNALEFGMKLEYVTRADFAFLSKNYIATENQLVIPEGGFGQLGFKGAATIGDCFNSKYDYIVCAIGTGTTIAGLSSNPEAKIVGINVLKGNETETLQNITTLNPDATIDIITNYHFGGYAKKNEELLAFMNQLYKTENLPTDFVYTAKMFYGLQQLIKSNYFAKNSKILAIHTGGLQGNKSLPKQTLCF